jgi:hypothetical protein
MDTASLIHTLSESAYFLVVSLFFLGLGMFKGRQALINITCGLYFALLISIHFPYYEKLLGSIERVSVQSGVKLIFFAALTFIFTKLFKRLMPSEYQEGKFESFHKKILLAGGASILVLAFSFNVLPVGEFLTTDTPIQMLFSNESFFFWWLLLPLVFLYLN